MTGDVVWAVSINQPALLGCNVSSEQQEFPLDATERFTSPAAGPTSVYVAAAATSTPSH